MKIALSTESSSDCPKELQKQHDIRIIPFTIVKGNKEIKDGDETLESLYAFTDETGVLPRTCAINVEEYRNHFASLLKTHDAVIHISMSHAVSSACQNAFAAASEFGNKVRVIDALTFHTGQLLLVIYAAALIKQKLPIDEIVEKLKARIPFISTTCTLETVNYLYKGGRCNALVMLGANLLHIRPQVVIKEGTIRLGKKFLGNRKKWTHDYIEFVMSHTANADKTWAFVSSTTEMNEAVEQATERLKEVGFQNIMYVKAGATIGTHTGPATFSIEYFDDGPHNW